MNSENAKIVWKYIQKAGDDLQGKLPSHPNHPKGRNPYAHIALCIKDKFQNSYKDIEDEKFDEVLEYIEFLKKTPSQPVFDKFRGKEISPGSEIQSDSEIEQAIRLNTITDYHQCGTCAMGTDVNSVVDSEMRVKGINSLRVVDASVLPNVVSGNIGAPVMMIAARAADWILGKNQLEPLKANFKFDQI